MKEQERAICERCRKPKAKEGRSGSLTSFLLSDLSCICEKVESIGQVSFGKPARAASLAEICRRCGKVYAANSRPGSMTSFFFKESRCNCPNPSLTSKRAAKRGRERSTQVRTAIRTRYSLKSLEAAQEAAAMAALQSGQVIGGCYELISLAGQGGMGSVFKAKHQTLGRKCAIKLLSPSVISESSWKLFKNEAKILASLQHQTICHIYDLGIARLNLSGRGAEGEVNLPYYAMDYVEGFTLESLLDTNGPISVGATIELFLKVCEGVSYAHRRGIIHKDLKPANLMLSIRGDNPEVKILDFGISELSETAGLTKDEVVGSAPYMSPEQFTGKSLDQRSDIYSLGCSMYEALVGHPPFDEYEFELLGKLHLKEVIPSLSEASGEEFPEELEAILSKCLQKSPDQRYQSVSELSIDLLRLLEGKPLQFAKYTQLEEKDLFSSINKPKTGKIILFTGVVLLLIGFNSLILTGILFSQPKKRFKVKLDNEILTNQMPSETDNASAQKKSNLTARTGSDTKSELPRNKKADNDYIDVFEPMPSAELQVTAKKNENGAMSYFFKNNQTPGLVNVCNEEGTIITYLPQGIDRIELEKGQGLALKEINGDYKYLLKAIDSFKPDDIFGVNINSRNLQLEKAAGASQVNNHVDSQVNSQVDIGELEKKLKSLKNLRTLSLPPQAMPMLKKDLSRDFQKLSKLSLYNTSTSDMNLAGLEHLQQLHLFQLEVAGNASNLISLLKVAANCPQLGSLRFYKANISQKDIYLLSQLPNLRSLDLVFCILPPADQIDFSRLTKVEYFSLAFKTTDGMPLNKIAQLSRLTKLKVTAKDYLEGRDKDFVAILQKLMPNTDVSLYQNPSAY
ncbi:MAG: Serine/threonine-protein kinase PknB [bacterium ADurb.Bin425]|nr:MAG: Serine/threonine-protein kinase PknB [bacterium ADurb.Bin425]